MALSSRSGNLLLHLLYLKVAYFDTQFAEASSEWSVSTIRNIWALKDSCVVIPCTYNHPPSSDKGNKKIMWHKDFNQYIYHQTPNKVLQEFKGRTRLIGDPQNKNCSLQIDPVAPDDKGPFHFRIEIDKLDKYSFMNDGVTVNINDKPEIMKNITCTAKITVTCWCTVDSNPHADIKWILANKTLPSSSLETKKTVTIGSLQGVEGFTGSISCFASNVHGSVTMATFLQTSDTMIYIYIISSAAAGVILLILAAAVLYKRKVEQSREKKDKTENIPEKIINPVYSKSCKSQKQYENASQLADIETSDCIYANNMILEDDIPDYEDIKDFEEDIYANM